MHLMTLNFSIVLGRSSPPVIELHLLRRLRSRVCFFVFPYIMNDSLVCELEVLMVVDQVSRLND